MIDKIALNRTEFKNKDEILKVFARGMMTGDLLEVGRLVDGTFGKGTLRTIAEMDEDVEKQLFYVKNLLLAKKSNSPA